MKLWGSVKQQANKLAFDAEKALRVKRQEGVISALRDKVQAQYSELGQATLALMDEGAIVHPQLAAFANEISTLQESIKDETAKLATIQAEEFESAEEAAAGPATAPASSMPPLEPRMPAPPQSEEPPTPPPPPVE